MDQSDKTHNIRESKAIAMALKNKNTVLLLAVMLGVFGLLSYSRLPKELFPDVVIPTVLVKTIYPGNPPVDMENLISRPLENEINTINGIKALRSTSSQDNSDIIVEFNTDVNIKEALLDVKDAVDRAKSDLPSDLPTDPIVLDVDFSEFPIINVNLSGEFSLAELKKYADYLEEEIEAVPEISKVEISGIEEREISIDVNPLSMEALKISFGDIENAIASENISIAGGQVLLNDKTRWSVRTTGEFKDVAELGNIIIKQENNNIVYLKDIAAIKDGYAEQKSISRLNKQTVITLQVIKKSGENLLSATQKIFNILDQSREKGLIPDDLKITITNDQSEEIRNQLGNLENNIISAIILVVLILYLFLGLKNALFVGISIPLSMIMSFVVFGLADVQINMIVLFSLIMTLGMLVDNSIVVVDNIFRFIQNGHSVFDAAKLATSEIAMPIIASTATTLAAFLPLAFWEGMVGEFMKYMPITLIIVLTSSLVVALFFVPVFSYIFYHEKQDQKKNNKLNQKTKLIIIGICLLVACPFYVFKLNIWGNIFLIGSILYALGQFAMAPLGKLFENKILPYLESTYERAIRFSLKGRNPVYFILGTIAFLILSITFYFSQQPKVNFFPVNEPKYINIIAELPVGTDLVATDSTMKVIENQVDKVIAPYRSIVKSVLSTVGKGAIGENQTKIGDSPNKGRITITFIPFKEREGIKTSDIMSEISQSLIGKFPGINFNIEKNSQGPPSGKAINIEVSGKDLQQLIKITQDIQSLIENARIDGIEGLKSDLNTDKPDINIRIDRDKARRFGLSTRQIAGTIRTALFGKEVSNFKVGEDKYPIMLRLKPEYRNNITALMDQKITFRNQATGRVMQIPISAIATVENNKSFDAIKRIDLKRAVTISSNIRPGFNATSINNQIKQVLASYTIPDGYQMEFTGEQKEQQDSMFFLIIALLIAVSLIALILVTQFNSVVKPLIIIASVVFSTAGVFLGLALFNMSFVIIMTGIGIVALAGVVVNNAIVLIDYSDYLRLQKRIDLGGSEKAFLPDSDTAKCLETAGKTRFRPVILTAVTTVLGLVPLAIGLNFDFVSLITKLNPQIYFGGDNAIYWGPLSWTIIFGLTVATFLTLIIVPCMYFVLSKVKNRFRA